MRNLARIWMSLVIVILILPLILGCSLADIRSDSLLVSGLDEQRLEKGRLLLTNVVRAHDPLNQWHRYDQWHIVADDIWKSNLIRRFTPIPQSVQTLEFRFALKSDYAEMGFQGGPKDRERYIVSNQQGFHVVNAVKTIDKGKKLMGYLPSMRDYFLWPQTLLQQDIIIFDGEMSIGAQEYQKVFVTGDSWNATENQDQFIVWINARTQRIDYIEFTLRDLLKSYRGVVAYSDYQMSQQMWVPFRITLTDRVADEKYSHEFIVHSMSFHKEKTR